MPHSTSEELPAVGFQEPTEEDIRRLARSAGTHFDAMQSLFHTVLRQTTLDPYMLMVLRDYIKPDIQTNAVFLETSSESRVEFKDRLVEAARYYVEEEHLLRVSSWSISTRYYAVTDPDHTYSTSSTLPRLCPTLTSSCTLRVNASFAGDRGPVIHFKTRYSPMRSFPQLTGSSTKSTERWRMPACVVSLVTQYMTRHSESRYLLRPCPKEG